MYEIVAKKELAPKIKSLDVQAPEIAKKVRLGQFMILINDEKGEPIPPTLADYDARKGTVAFAFNEVRKITKELGCLKVGDFIERITRPLGNPSEIRKLRQGLMRCWRNNDCTCASANSCLKRSWK